MLMKNLRSPTWLLALVLVPLLVTVPTFSAMSSATSSSSTPSSEFLALHSFFNATNGHQWDPRCSSNWNFTCLAPGASSHACPDPCSLTQPWGGLACYGPNVSSIRLPSCLLRGSLPEAALNKLQMVTVLDVENNNLTSTLPLITELPNFYQFNVARNKFTGTIPALSTTLFFVFFKENDLTGVCVFASVSVSVSSSTAGPGGLLPACLPAAVSATFLQSCDGS